MNWKYTHKDGLPKEEKYYLCQFHENQSRWEVLKYIPNEKHFLSDRTDALCPIKSEWVYSWCEITAKRTQPSKFFTWFKNFTERWIYQTK